MRRSLLVLLCLAGLGFVVIVFALSTRRWRHFADTELEGRRNGDGIRVAPAHAEVGESGENVGIAQEMAWIRANSFERASHSLLFSMAQDRGVASGRSRSTRNELLDAIFTAEGLNAGQSTSPVALQRLRTLADEVGRQESDAIAAIVLRARRSYRDRSRT